MLYSLVLFFFLNSLGGTECHCPSPHYMLRSGIFVSHRALLLYSASPPYNVQKRWQAAFDNVNLTMFSVKRELVVVRCGQQVVI